MMTEGLKKWRLHLRLDLIAFFLAYALTMRLLSLSLSLSLSLLSLKENSTEALLLHIHYIKQQLIKSPAENKENTVLGGLAALQG